MSPGMVSVAFLTVLALALGLIVGGWMVVGLLGMLLNWELTCGEFLLWTLAFTGLLVTTLAAVGSALFPLLIVLTVGLGLGVPLSSWLADRLGAQRLRVQDIERYLRGTQERPDIPHNYRKLGDLYYESGDWGTAVEWYEKSLKVHADPHVSFMLDKARERRSLGKGEPVLCLCGKLNPRHAQRCLHCGATLPGAHELLTALGAGHGRMVLLLLAAGLLSGGIALCLLRVGVAFLNGLLLLLGVGAAVLHFYATQAVGTEVRGGGGGTSDFRPRTPDSEGRAEAKSPKE
jgi:hypothetical protein